MPLSQLKGKHFQVIIVKRLNICGVLDRFAYEEKGVVVMVKDVEDSPIKWYVFCIYLFSFRLVVLPFVDVVCG